MLDMDFNGYGQASQEMIDRFEQYIGFTLPDDYKAFLLAYNGGKTAERDYDFYVEELQENIPLQVLYGLDVEKKQVNLKIWYDEYRDELFENCIIIGCDPGSGMIVLIGDGEEQGVYYWDHAWHFEQSNEEGNTYKIADTFQKFMSGLRKQ